MCLCLVGQSVRVLPVGTSLRHRYAGRPINRRTGERVRVEGSPCGEGKRTGVLQVGHCRLCRAPRRPPTLAPQTPAGAEASQTEREKHLLMSRHVDCPAGPASGGLSPFLRPSLLLPTTLPHVRTAI